MKTLHVHSPSSNVLEITVPGRKTERLSIGGDFPDTHLGRQLFHDLGAMHLIAPYFPRKVTMDGPFSGAMAEMVDGMYASFRRKPPYLDRVPDMRFPGVSARKARPRAVVAYSAGKDSLWNMSWAIREYGRQNVMTVHVSGMNRAQASFEREWSARQAETLGFAHYRVVDLRNSSTNTGYTTMRSRDLLLAGIMVPLAVQFGARDIITEGFAETNASALFSGQAATMHRFNERLAHLGLRQRVVWRDRPEIEIIGDLYKERPGWMPLVCNCFAAPCYKPGIRRSWARNAPTFALYESQCGSCAKCRIVNVARMRFDQELLRSANGADIRTYLKGTAAWTRKHRASLGDMLSASYLATLRGLLKQYRLDPASIDVTD